MERLDYEIKVYDNIIEITPKEGIKPNSKYEIRLNNIKTVDKKKTMDKEKVSICTALTPSYTTLDAVKVLIDVCDIPDSEILFQIREASKFADYLRTGGTNTTTFVNNTDIMIPRIKDSINIDTNASDGIPYEVEEFSKYKAAKDCLVKFYIGKAAMNGEKGQVGDISFEHGSKMPDISKFLGELDEQIRFWKDAVRGYGIEGRAKPKMTLRSRNAIPLDLGTGSSLSPAYLDYDRGIN